MKSEIITALEQHIASECKEIDREKRFNEMLDECYSFEKVGGPFEHMSPSSVLKEVDPVAYRCGVNDYEDGEGWVEIDGSCYDRDDVEKAVESFTEEIEGSISDMEQGIEEIESEENPSQENLTALKRSLAEKQAALKEVEAYSY